MAWLSIMGMYNSNINVFEGFQVPQGLDRQTAIDTIILNCAELEVVYPTIDIMRYAITNWSKRNQPVWQKLWDTVTVKYNPIWNVDGIVEETETRDLTNTKTGTNTDGYERRNTGTETLDNTKTETGTETFNKTVTAEGSITSKVKGYNETAWVDSEQSVPDTEDHDDTTRTPNITQTDDTTRTPDLTETNEGHTTFGETYTDKGKVTHTTKRTGNIGVTMTQDMLKAEREVAMFDIYEKIMISFKKEFCLMIY